MSFHKTKTHGCMNAVLFPGKASWLLQCPTASLGVLAARCSVTGVSDHRGWHCWGAQGGYALVPL